MSINNIFIIVVTLLVFSSCNQRKETKNLTNTLINESELQKELLETVRKVWEDANKSNIQALKSAHLNSPKFSKFGPRIAERQDVNQTIKSETEHFSSIKDANLVIEDLKIDIFDKVGVATFYNNYSFIKNDNEVQGKGRVTLVFLRTEEGWKIIHEHSSPFNEY